MGSPVSTRRHGSGSRRPSRLSATRPIRRRGCWPGGGPRTLGVMAVETEQFGPSHMLFGIEAAAREAGHLLSFVTLSRSGNDLASTLDRLRASHVQGVIVVAPVKRVIEAAARLDGDMP